MVRSKYKEKYTAMSMPKKLLDEVKKYIEEHPELQYRSIPEFTKVALREKLEREKLDVAIGGLSTIGYNNTLEEILIRLDKIEKKLENKKK